MDFLPWTTFARIVDRYDGNHRVRTLACTEHFRVLAFAQLTYRESLRDIEAVLSAQSAKLYHMGIRAPVRRSTLADASERRDWRIYAEFAQRLMAQARKLHAEEDLDLDLQETQMIHDLDGKRIIVTGAATGIGRATAEMLISRRASVALWDINPEHCETLVPDGTEDQTVICCDVDVGDGAAVASATKESVATLGGLDGAFNNAGIGLPSLPTHAVAETDFDEIVRVNFKGVWLCMKHQIEVMQASSSGSIVNNASVAGLAGFALQGPYTGTKHAVVGMTKAAAVEVAEAGIRLNAVCPEATKTPILRHLVEAGITEDVLSDLTPQKRIANPEEIASAVCWLLSDQSSFVTGVAMPVDGGWSAN